MTGAAHTQPASELLTYDDLRAEPDDGRRRELIDGQLLVTPAPIPLHQIAVARLLALLLDTAPVQLEVLPAPVDWKLTGAGSTSSCTGAVSSSRASSRATAIWCKGMGAGVTSSCPSMSSRRRPSSGSARRSS